MPAPVGRHAGQPSRVASNAREQRYGEAVGVGQEEDLLRSGLNGTASGAAPSLWANRLLHRIEVRSGRTLRFAPAWLATGIAPVTSIAESLHIGSAGAVSSALPWVVQPPSEQCANSWACGLALSTVGCVITRSGGGVQDSAALQMGGFWCLFSCKCGGGRGLDLKSSSSLLHHSCGRLSRAADDRRRTRLLAPAYPVTATVAGAGPECSGCSAERMTLKHQGQQRSERVRLNVLAPEAAPIQQRFRLAMHGGDRYRRAH